MVASLTSRASLSTHANDSYVLTTRWSDTPRRSRCLPCSAGRTGLYAGLFRLAACDVLSQGASVDCRYEDLYVASDKKAPVSQTSHKRLPGLGRRALVSAVAAATCFAVAGCGGDGSATVTEALTQNISPPDLPEIPTVRDAQGARRDVEMGECAVTPGPVTVQGTVTNPTAKPVDYAITISWINDRSDVRARGTAVVRNVAPKKPTKWTVKVDLDADNATQCTLFAERGRVTP